MWKTIIEIGYFIWIALLFFGVFMAVGFLVLTLLSLGEHIKAKIKEAL